MCLRNPDYGSVLDDRGHPHGSYSPHSHSSLSMAWCHAFERYLCQLFESKASIIFVDVVLVLVRKFLCAIMKQNILPGCKHVVLWRTVSCSSSGKMESSQEGGIKGSYACGIQTKMVNHISF